jgi:hypothetical protein
MCIFLENRAKPPIVEAIALHPASIANFMLFSGSKYMGFGVNELPAVCSIPWSTGKIERYPFRPFYHGCRADLNF